MKKTLALALAILMLTASLAACSKKENTPPVDDEDDGYVTKDTKDTSDTNDSDENNDSNNNNDTDNNGNSNDNNNNNLVGWMDSVDTVYAGVRLNLRTSAAMGNNNIAKEVPFGTKLNRTATNSVWSKVTLDGDTTEYYVSNDWISSTAGHFSYNSCEPVALTINDTPNNIIFFTSPFECEDNELYFSNAVCASGFKLSNVSEGYSLKKVATSASGSWIKVEFVGTITISANNTKTYTADAPGELYVKVRAIERGDITDSTHTNNPSGGGSGALG